MNNIDGNVLNSPFSLIISIILCLGVLNLGSFFQEFLIKKKVFTNFRKKNYLYSPIIGAYLIILFLYPIIIFEISSIFFINFTAYFLFFISILKLNEIKKVLIFLFNQIKTNKDFSFYLILLIYFLYSFIAASPTTHADAIDYHFLGSLEILRSGHFQKEILPMNNHLSSLGEMLMAVGLVFKAEQFLSLVQFLSLFALIPLFKKDKSGYSFLLFILVCPITFFLLSSSKPQLIFCVSTLLIFAFLIKNFSKISLEDSKKILPFILIILCINSLSKYSFHLSSLLISLLTFYLMYKKGLLRYSIFVSIIVFSFLYIPHLSFRAEHFQTHFIDSMMSPLPINIYGFQAHHDLLSGGNLNLLDIFLPTNILSLTTTYGPLLILIFFMIDRSIKKYLIPFIIILSFIICVFIFGSNLPRFLFEGFLWLVFLVSTVTKKKSIIYLTFSKLVFLQVFAMVFILFFYIFSIFPGSLNNSLKERIMINNANGYQLASWANDVLDKKDVLISTHRSISLFENETFSDIFTWHVNLSKPDAKIYLDFLKSKKVNRILFYINDLEKQNYQGCIGEKLYFNDKAGKHVGRNPFRTSNYYSAWIYEFKYKELPGCMQR